MTKIICEILLYVLLLGLGVVCLSQVGAFLQDMKEFLQDLRQPGAIKEFLGFGAVMALWVCLFFIF